MTARQATLDELPELAAFGAELDLAAPAWRCEPARPNPDRAMLERLAGSCYLARADDEVGLAGYLAIKSSGTIKWLVVPEDRVADAGTALLDWSARDFADVRGSVASPAVRAALLEAGCTAGAGAEIHWPGGRDDG